MSLQDITPLILTYNEEPNIGRVLEKLRWAERIVVVDSHSTDRTAEIASALPQVSLLRRPFDNHVDQWNFGLDQVTTPWVLSLDADYVLSRELVDELAARADSLDAAGYYASFRYCIAGRPLRGSLYPPRIVLFRRDRALYEADGHTQRLRADGPTGQLSGVIFHDDRKPLGAWLQAQQRYSLLEVEKLTATPMESLGLADRIRRRKWLAPLLAPPYCLFAKGLILDGWPGLYYTLQRTYVELLLSLRLFEHEARASGARREPG
jgi:glycosyltransferase involved in cell wall biosynthesis